MQFCSNMIANILLDIVFKYFAQPRTCRFLVGVGGSLKRIISKENMSGRGNLVEIEDLFQKTFQLVSVQMKYVCG